MGTRAGESLGVSCCPALQQLLQACEVHVAATHDDGDRRAGRDRHATAKERREGGGASGLGKNLDPLHERTHRVHDLPVIDDRDYTIQVTWGADGPILWMRFTAANERGPKPVADVVRVNTHEGAWRFEPEGGKGTRAVYRFHLDVAGNVPSWLGKGQAKDDIIDFFVRLNKELPKYR